MKCGIDAFDAELKSIAKDERPELENLVYRVMDGDSIDMSALLKEQAYYVKTAKVLLGQTLYSDSWLEL